jgi:hypothetical protein
MADLKQCDRCKKIESSIHGWAYVRVWPLEHKGDDYMSDMSLELCSACLYQLKGFLKPVSDAARAP